MGYIVRPQLFEQVDDVLNVIRPGHQLQEDLARHQDRLREIQEIQRQRAMWRNRIHHIINTFLDYIRDYVHREVSLKFYVNYCTLKLLFQNFPLWSETEWNEKRGQVNRFRVEMLSNYHLQPCEMTFLNVRQIFASFRDMFPSNEFVLWEI